MQMGMPKPPNMSDPENNTPLLSVERKGLLTIAVMGAMIIQILDSTIANVAIPHMQTSLGATLDTISWVLTSYIVASAVAIPITGWVSDYLGSRRLFLIAVGGFIVMSMCCGAAANLTQMVLFRVLQGICAAFIGPMSQTIMMDINPPANQGRAMGMWGLGIMAAPIFGPLIGGWLTESYSWRWVFYVNLPIGIPTLVALWWLLPSRPINKRKLDLFGFSMLALSLATLQLVLDRGQHKDWLESWEIRIELIFALSCLWVFLIHMFTSKRPLLSRALFADRNFSASLWFSLMIGVAMMAVFALLPSMMQNLYGYGVIETGALMAPRGVGMGLGIFVAGRLAAKIGLKTVMALGFLGLACSMWLMTQWSLVMGSASFIIVGVVQGFGMGMSFLPSSLIAFSTLSPKYRAEGTSIFYLARSLGGSIGISVATTVLARNIQVSHADIAANLTASSVSSVDLSGLDRFGEIGSAVLQMLDGEVNRQAAMIAYLDDFKMMMIAMICAIPLIFVLKATSTT
jgi:MFS transporter, DHA2 family, multidrug resistance protein